MITLYHITDRRNVGCILKQGLVAKIGNNSQLVDEEKACIYLSDKASLPYWLTLLNRQNAVVLRVQLKSYPKRIQYGRYKEYRAQKTIPASQISIARDLPTRGTPEIMRVLCRDYVYTLGYICVSIVRFYEHKIDALDTRAIEITLNVTERLNFNCCLQAEWRAYLKQLGENGEYTFCDLYAIGTVNPPLWAKILTYPQDEYTHLRTRVSQVIQTKFYGCLDICTGGWTG